ncbi:MAG: hypothetical protein ACFFB3_16200 [Candidatus Hodarchaeota archaeon]
MLRFSRLSLLFILTVAGFLGFLTSEDTVAVASRPNDLSLETTIIWANYTDWDNDGAYDDTYYILDLDFSGTSSNGIVIIDIYLELLYPSGTVANGHIRISVYAVDQTITIYCLDSVTETGWYTVTITTVLVGSGGGPDVSVSSYLFDPPTGKGNGLPQ